MAKTWKVGEAARAVKFGTLEEKRDIVGRYPLFGILAAQLNEAALEILDCVPDYCSARKIESVLKGELPASAEGGEEHEEAPAAPAKPATSKPAAAPAKPAAAPAKTADPYAGKTAKELYDLCKTRKIEVETKQPADAYAKLLKAADAKKAKAEADKKAKDAAAKAKPAAKPAAEDEWADEDAPATPAEGDDDEWNV